MVRNAGTTDARPSRVLLRVGDTPLVPQPVAGLAASQTATVTVAGPPCLPGQALRAAVDAAGDVEEADEADNALVQRCVAG